MKTNVGGSYWVRRGIFLNRARKFKCLATGDKVSVMRGWLFRRAVEHSDIICQVIPAATTNTPYVDNNPTDVEQ